MGDGCIGEDASGPFSVTTATIRMVIIIFFVFLRKLSIVIMHSNKCQKKKSNGTIEGYDCIT